MAEPRKQYPFVVRALFFATIYTVIALIAEYFLQLYQDTGTHLPDEERVGRYFLIGLVVATATLLFTRKRVNLKR